MTSSAPSTLSVSVGGDVSKIESNEERFNIAAASSCLVVVIPVDAKSGSIQTDLSTSQCSPNEPESIEEVKVAIPEASLEDEDHRECCSCCGDWKESRAAVTPFPCLFGAVKALSIINACLLVIIIALIPFRGGLGNPSALFQIAIPAFAVLNVPVVISQIIGSWRKNRLTLRVTWWVNMGMLVPNIAVLSVPVAVGIDWIPAGVGLAYCLFQIPWFIVASSVLGRVAPKCCGCGC